MNEKRRTSMYHGAPDQASITPYGCLCGFHFRSGGGGGDTLLSARNLRPQLRSSPIARTLNSRSQVLGVQGAGLVVFTLCPHTTSTWPASSAGPCHLPCQGRATTASLLAVSSLSFQQEPAKGPWREALEIWFRVEGGQWSITITKPSNLNPKLSTLNPEPSTLNPQP